MPDNPTDRERYLQVQVPLTVSSVTAALKRTIEARFANVSVEGEILSCKRASSGHVYFTLKDSGAQLPTVLWRDRANRLRMDLRDGMKVVVTGSIQVYPPHGKYQLVARDVRQSGLGELLLKLHALKQALEQEGLFDPARKKKIPIIPRAVGVATAITGAAVRDIVRTIHDQFPARIIIAPCQVQGRAAAPTIVRALQQLDAHPEVDVIICGRGGGSLEDLWAFNEETVARAIAACITPVISAVGHESDTLLTDAVADRRAATPTAAAELVVPNLRDLKHWLQDRLLGIAKRTQTNVLLARRHFEQTRNRLPDPSRWIQERHQHLDEARAQMQMALRSQLTRSVKRHVALAGRLRNLHPRNRLAAARQRLAYAEERLKRAISLRQRQERTQLERTRRALALLGPASNLERGYAIVRNEDGSLVRDVDAVEAGRTVQVLLRRGALDAQVVRTHERHLFEVEDGT